MRRYEEFPLHLGHSGSCSSKHRRSLRSLPPACSPGSWLDSRPVGPHCLESRTPDNLGSSSTAHPGNAQTLSWGRSSPSRLTGGSRTGSRQVLKDSTSVTWGTWGIQSQGPGARGLGSQGGRMSRRPTRRRQLDVGRRRRTSRSSSGSSPHPGALGSCCPLVSRGTHTMSGRRRRADDPMVLIHTDESKLNIKGAGGEKNCQMIFVIQKVLTFKKVCGVQTARIGLSRYKEDSLLRYYGFGSAQKVYCGGGGQCEQMVPTCKGASWCPGPPIHPNEPH